MDETTISSAPEGAAPVDFTPMSEDEGDRAIENILAGNAPAKADHVAEGEAQPGAETSTEEDEPLVITDENENPQQIEHAPAKPQTVGHDAMVALEDGRQISVGELIRGTMFQRDYTFKLDGLKKQANDFATWQNTEVQRISQYRDQVLALAQKYVPQPPDRSMLDPNSPNYDFLGYMEQQARYETAMEEVGTLNQQKQADEQAFKERYEADMAKSRVQQLEMFYLGAPKLRDKTQREAFFQDVRNIVPAAYKLDPEELLGLENSGTMLMLYDAIRYRKALAESKKVAQELPAAPKLQGRQRATPQSDQQRDASGRFASLRATGSVEAADRAIEAILSRQ